MKRIQSSSLKQAFFGPPYLPRILVPIQILLVITQAGIELSNQPAAYWLDPPQASAESLFRSLLKFGPLIFAAIAVLYLILIALLLSYIRRPVAIALFGILFFAHSELLFRSMNCNWLPFFAITNPDSCNTFWGIRFYLWMFLLGLLILVVFLWKDRISERLKRWGLRSLMALGSVWLILLGVGIWKVATPPTSGWKPVISAHSPGPRSLAAIAYDTKRGRAVLFGGVSQDVLGNTIYHSDTWEWDGKDWTEVQASGGPSGRMLHTMAYDEKRGVVVLYGGWYQGNALMDVWEWDGQSWKERCPVCNPAGRYYHQMFYDPVLGKVVIYGGSSPDKAFHEAWAWDGQAWNSLAFDAQTPDFSADNLVYDTRDQQVIAFLGEDWGGTWTWKGSSWAKATLSLQPPRRQYFSMTYDPVLDRTILFGGKIGNTWLSDTWLFKDNNWSQVQGSVNPPARTTPVSFYDAVRGKVMLYGGEQGATILGDMWELDLP